jgi:hypothetical protein
VIHDTHRKREREREREREQTKEREAEKKKREGGMSKRIKEGRGSQQQQHIYTYM